jgi:CcmD family protein
MSPLYFVMFVALAIWFGLFAYLWRLDVRMRDIQRRLKDASVGNPMGLDAPEAVLEPGAGASPGSVP